MVPIIFFLGKTKPGDQGRGAKYSKIERGIWIFSRQRTPRTQRRKEMGASGGRSDTRKKGALLCEYQAISSLKGRARFASRPQQ